jgi:hypothetical protein
VAVLVVAAQHGEIVLGQHLHKATQQEHQAKVLLEEQLPQ